MAVHAKAGTPTGCFSAGLTEQNVRKNFLKIESHGYDKDTHDALRTRSRLAVTPFR